jgi:Family of unknown function (DUF6958)
MAEETKVAVENVNHPGKTTSLDKAPYEAMKKAMLRVLPRKQPGFTPEEIQSAVLPLLPEDVFPGGAKAGWWTKCVQLDLEAKGIIVRSSTRPLRLTRVK